MKPVDKQQSLEWQWLQKALYGDDDKYSHKILTGINFTAGQLQGADGWRAHLVNKKWHGVERVVKLNEGKPLNETPKDYSEEEIHGNFPDIEKCIPTSEIVEYVVLNRQFLLDAASMPCEHILIELRGDHKPVVIKDFNLDNGTDGDNYIAVIMPMNVNRK